MDLNLPINFNYTTCNWTAPAITELDFSTDCTIVAEWARTWLSGDTGVNDLAAAQYFGQALPPELRKALSRGQLIDWYHALLQGYLVYKKNNPYNGSNASPWKTNVTNGPFNACLESVCQRAEWSGVPDILGPGVMTSAFLQAILATTLAIVPLWEQRLRWKGIAPGPRFQWIIDVCNAILGLFVDTGLLLSLWINIAAIMLTSRRNHVGDGAQIALAHDIAVFSIHATMFPQLADLMVHKETKRQHLRLSLLAILLILFIVMSNMAGALSTSFNHTSEWELFCFWDIIPTERRVTLPVIMTLGAVVWLWVLVFGLLPTLLDKCWATGAGKLRQWRKVIYPYLVFSSGFSMWYMLITITVVRQLLLARSGFNSEDTNMSFGQMLALGTWMPMFVELTYIFRKGLDGYLSDRVPDGWVVVRAEQAALLPQADDTAAASTTESLAPADGHSEEQELLVVDPRRRSQMSSRASNTSVQLMEEASSIDRHVPRSTTL